MAPDKPLQTAISAIEACRIRELLRRKERIVGKDRRQRHRYDFEGDLLVVSMQEPGATAPAADVVFARNISGRGMGFFHHGKVRPGTECVIGFQAADGQPREIAGIIVRCSHVEGLIYEVGMRTTMDIDVGFLPQGEVSYPD